MLQRERVCCLLLSFFISSLIYILHSLYDYVNPLLKDSSGFLIGSGNPISLTQKARCLTLWFQPSFPISSFTIQVTRDFRLFPGWVFVFIALSLSASKILPSFTWKILTYPSTLDSNITSFLNPFLTPRSSSGLHFRCINCKLYIYVFSQHPAL